MVDYYWAKQHSNYQAKEHESTKVNSLKEDDLKDDKDIQDCLNFKRAPDYLNNLTGICFPNGLPPPKHVKFSINQDSCQLGELNSQKIVFYSTKTFAGKLHYLSILIFTKPVIVDETIDSVSAVLDPFAIVLVTE